VWLQVAGYGTHNTYLRNPEQTVRVTPDQIVESVDASLKRLGTDYIDLLQVTGL
jgi:aryl-alcohol dehydrogenase-like predicted oxidoreductase